MPTDNIDQSTTLQTFTVTFGQSHPLRDCWIEIKAPSLREAHDLAMNTFGQHFSMMRSLDQFDPSFFPGGKVGRTIY